MGLGDTTTSQGILQQSAQIRAMGKDVQTSVWTYKAWPEVIRRLYADNGRNKHVIIGYSCGASAMEYIADSNLPFELVVAEDPTIWLNPTATFRGNAKKVICFHNYNIFNGVGLAGCQAGDGLPASALTVINTADIHGYVDIDPGFQKTIYAAVQIVVNAP